MAATPSSINDTLKLAASHHDGGRFEKAEALYRKVLRRQPDNASALASLAHLAHQSGNHAEAIDLIRRVIEIAPLTAEYHNTLGSILATRGKLAEGIAGFERALALKPDYAAAHRNLANALKLSGRFDEAIGVCRGLLSRQPEDVKARALLGGLLSDTGHREEAIAAYQRVIALSPRHPTAHNNLGVLLRETGGQDGAIAAFGRAAEISPQVPIFQSNLAGAIWGAGRVAEAVEIYSRVVEKHPDSIAADTNRIYALHFHPDYDGPAILREQRKWAARHAGDPSQRSESNEANHGAGASRPGRAEGTDSELRSDRAVTARLRSAEDRAAMDASPGRRLRIGYVSPDFRDHVVARSVLPLLREHDRGAFQIFCYSGVTQPDAVTQQIRGYATEWRDTAGLDDEQLADLVRDDRIDILVDLAMHMNGSRLLTFARRPASVQVAFAYPGGTGLEAMGYRITDPYLDPPGAQDEWYAERSVRLPETFWCYKPVMDNGVQLAPGEPPATRKGFITFGCLNSFMKVNDAILATWAKVLNVVADSRLLLLAPPGSARERTAEHLEKAGVSRDRLEFVAHQSRVDYLRTYQRIDIGLDTLPYNGHTTSLDSLWMGVPIVSLVGKTAAGRAGLSQLSNLGLRELIATNEEQFVAVAAGLAADPSRLGELRMGLRTRMEQSPLMNAPRFARNVEDAYRQMLGLGRIDVQNGTLHRSIMFDAG